MEFMLIQLESLLCIFFSNLKYDEHANNTY